MKLFKLEHESKLIHSKVKTKGTQKYKMNMNIANSLSIILNKINNLPLHVKRQLMALLIANNLIPVLAMDKFYFTNNSSRNLFFLLSNENSTNTINNFVSQCFAVIAEGHELLNSTLLSTQCEGELYSNGSIVDPFFQNCLVTQMGVPCEKNSDTVGSWVMLITVSFFGILIGGSSIFVVLTYLYMGCKICFENIQNNDNEEMLDAQLINIQQAANASPDFQTRYDQLKLEFRIDIPNYFKCDRTDQLMNFPITLPTGETIDKSSDEEGKYQHYSKSQIIYNKINNFINKLENLSDPLKYQHSIELNESIDFNCPIWKSTMKEPVTLSSGITFEKSAILRALMLQGSNKRCPVTKKVVKLEDIDQPSATIKLWISEQPASRAASPLFSISSNSGDRRVRFLTPITPRNGVEGMSPIPTIALPANR